MAQLTLIAAMTPTRVIGINNQLPWHLPADLAYFKAKTLDKPIIMGRHTFLSIGKALPRRDNWIVSTTMQQAPENMHIVTDLSSAITHLANTPEIMIIGGAKLYTAAIDLADCLQLTIVEANIDGDTYFPAWDLNHWQLSSETIREPDSQNPYRLRFQTWKRV